MKPSAFSRYKVGIRAGDDVALAIEVALDLVGPQATMATPATMERLAGRFAAFAAAERIIKNAERASESSEAWEDAAEHLAWVLGQTRQAYKPDNEDAPAHAHDADIIQAVSFLGFTYPGHQGLRHQGPSTTSAGRRRRGSVQS